MRASMFADYKHLAKMRFGLSVTFEAVFVSTLLFADLTVPAESLETLGLHLVSNVLRSADYEFKEKG